MSVSAIRLAAAATLCLSAACASPTPSSPSRSATGGHLEIRGTTLMMVGGRGRLSAWRLADGQMREVSAAWTTDSDVISIGSGGDVSARRLGTATVRAAYQDLTGTEIVHVVGSVAGTWRGSLIFVDCSEPSVAGPQPCREQRPATAPLELTVSQSGAAELGNITGTIAAFNPPATGRFVGLFDSFGTFFVQGQVERLQDRVYGSVSLRWYLDGDQLAPMTEPDGITDVLLTVSAYTATGPELFTEIWKIGRLTR